MLWYVRPFRSFDRRSCGPESTNIIDTKNITKNITNSVQQSMSSNTDDTISNQTQNVNISGLNPQLL